MSELTAGQPSPTLACSFPNPLDIYGGDQLAKDRDDWLTLRAALAALKAYHPVDARGWPSEIHCTVEVLRHALTSMRSGGRVDDETQRLEKACKAYGAWQEQVTWAESENCSRVIGLVWLVETAEGIAERRQNADVRMMGALFRKELREAYRVEEWPADYHERRQWAQRVTRRYDAMPREWRGL